MRYVIDNNVVKIHIKRKVNNNKEYIEVHDIVNK